MRVGHGLDAHRFATAGELTLGGVTIPGAPALEGHSDGDALLHAVVDALLGAAGLGDIGMLFGSADPAYAGAASGVFVAETLRLVGEAGWEPANVDCTVIAQRPRIGPHRQRVRASLAGLLGLAEDAVNVKATTTDGLGVTGRGEGLACVVVATLRPRPAAADG